MTMRYASLLLLAVGCTILSPAQERIDDASILMKTDTDFDLAVSQHGVDAWVSFFAPNGSMINDTLPPTTGREAIRKAMARAFADTNFSLRWTPAKAEMMIPGALGYTVGRWERTRFGSDGKRTRATGTYSTVWKRQPDGAWKVVLDTGEDDK
jgi:ketosteroid isomerase-like protein